jgi:hypothetical protein
MSNKQAQGGRMKKTLTALALFSACLLYLSFASYAQTPQAQYVGVKKCKMCHQSVEKGNQFGIWEASLHAKAFDTLATDAAKEVAKKTGLTTDPQASPECLKCHVTGYEAPATAKTDSWTQTDGVGCESCHGAGSLYKSMKVMKDLTAGTQDPDAVGFITGKKETCLKCHNESSPTFKPFNFEERYKIIAHPLPKK